MNGIGGADLSGGSRAGGPADVGTADAGTGAAATHGGDTADRVAAAVRAVPGVAGLHGGLFGEAATYLPGRRLLGVRLGPDRADVHVRAEYGHRLPDLADRVRRAVEEVAGVSGPVDVEIADIGEPRPDSGREHQPHEHDPREPRPERP